MLGGVFFIFVSFVIPIAMIGLAYILLFKLVKLIRLKNKAPLHYMKILAIFVFCVCTIMTYLLPIELRYLITELRFSNVLEVGTPIGEVERYLAGKEVKYSVWDEESCSNNYSKRYCEKVPNVHIVSPMMFSHVPGIIRIQVFFDKNHNVADYKTSHMYRFL